ncbi:MAG TPA: NAD-dependent epimerase/dehydratase family protein, partial [Longimicrobium sp.]|nr:NAD-dependent epimerase/dehydratase family protein [Longimicrobium sp.]
MTGPHAGHAPPAGRVLVTGASGFVGAWLCAHWARAGVAVRGLVRDPGAALPAGVEPAPVRGLDDADGLRRAVAGVDAVVHLAARVHVMRDDAADPLGEFRRVNVEGTRALLAAAREAGAG